jgi:hypothetical protein
MSRSRLIFLIAAETMLVCLLGIVLTGHRPTVQAGAPLGPRAPLQAGAKAPDPDPQGGTPQYGAYTPKPQPPGANDTSGKPLLAEQVHSDIQVLKGIPEDEFMDTMGFFAASLSMNCTDCHVDASLTHWADFATPTLKMITARKMVTMVRAINKDYFSGARLVTCYTCHRDTPGPPEVTPSLVLQYANPVELEPEHINRQAADQPLPDKIFTDYIAAIGGQAAVDGLKSYTAAGTYEGFDTEHARVPFELYVENGAKRTAVIHSLSGITTQTFDGKNAWISSVTKPIPLMALTGGDLSGAKADAIVALPSQIKGSMTNWRTGNDFTINDNDVYVVQGLLPDKSPVKLYFDEKTHLLVRQVRYTNTAVGSTPAQVDYSDFRDVNGVKMPFHLEFTWTDGQSTILLNDIKGNAEIEAAKFDKPAPAVNTLPKNAPSITGKGTGN